jgi:hypothetical protein
MNRKLLFEDANNSLLELAKNIRGSILTEFYYMDISKFEHVNTKHLTKKRNHMEYISHKDDIYFFTQFKGVETHEVISNIIFKMNKN